MIPDTSASFSPSLELSPSEPQRRAARWRWWIALAILVLAPFGGQIVAKSRGAADSMVLPRSVTGLLLFSGLELAGFAVIFGMAWGFSRANRDELFLRWRNGWRGPLWGWGYSILMRIGIMIASIAIFMVAAIVLSLLGFKTEAVAEWIRANSGGAEKVFVPAMIQGTPLYRLLMITLVSFVVAGLREELWRTAMLASVFHLAPRGWSARRLNLVALGTSSALFGMAHLYQGTVGVFQTALLGLAMGAITLHHKSIWPAVFAHGFFDATSFIALLVFSEFLPR